MSLARLMSQPLTVQAVGPATQDIYSDWIQGPLGAPVSVLGYLELTTTVEYKVNRDTTVTTWTAFLPAGTVIGPLSYVTYQAQKFQVEGQPWFVYHPRTKAISHIVCKVVVVSG